VVELAVKLGVALNCEIEQNNFFARKNYFYPDLPKGYQISQHTAPICKGGFVSIASADGKKKIQLNRIHIEEDAGKSIHDLDEKYSCIDLNRAGVPLVEIVTEPVIHSADDTFLFLTELRKILRWLDVCDGNMEEGSMRCDANISIRLKGDHQLGKRVEVKNLNSIRNVKRAIEIEFERLIDVTQKNEIIIQETRSYDADKNITFSLRSKEEAEDYRYFPEPDLPAFFISEEYIEQIKSALPELPELLKDQFISSYGLSEYDANNICNDKEDVSFFNSLIQYTSHYKAVANWMLGPLKFYCNEHHISFSAFPLSPPLIAELIELTEAGKLSFANATGKVLQALILNPQKTAIETALSLNLIQENDEAAVMAWIEETINAMPEKVKEYKSGKKGLIGLFSGEVKKRSKGKADMESVTRLLNEKLNQ
jgi:aspartyl-tRNA(Asn)/glutamyl-tRNA(Gln) amidotransferase subunit B